MADHDRSDAPRLPARDSASIGGSLADHVRAYAATDPQIITARDHLAELAERVPSSPAAPPTDAEDPFGHLAGAEPVPGRHAVPITPAPESSEEVWATIPPGVDRVLTKDDAVAVYNGGLWTLTFPDSTRRQLGHGHFVHTQGPFRPAPPATDTP